MSYFLLYLVLAFFAGMIGKGSKLGFWGFFFLSLFMTPLIGLTIATLGSADAKAR